MLSDQPEWFKELARGIIDLHVHPSPCIYTRVGDELDISRQAQSVGYKGILFKSHLGLNACKASIVRKVLPGFEAHGGIVLSSFTGGLNPDAVEVAIHLGAKEVWMPVFHSRHHIQRFGYPGLPRLEPKMVLTRPKKGWGGLTILDEHDQLLPEVQEILGIIADNDVILGTGHMSLKENTILIEAASRSGVKKMLVTHAEHPTTGWSVEDQVKMADMGATIEHCYPSNKKDVIAEALKTVGPERCVMATDGGTNMIPHPVDSMRLFIKEMLDRGLDEKAIETMTKENPLKLLDVD